MRPFLLSLLLIASPLLAQSPSGDMRVVLPKGPGSIRVHLPDGWKLENFSLYIDGMHGSDPIYRPVLQIRNPQEGFIASYILYINDTKAPTAEGCRDAERSSINAAKKFAKEQGGQIVELKDSSYTTADGRVLPTSTHMFEGPPKYPIHQYDTHGYIGDTSNCAVIHLSKEHYQPDDDKAFHSLMDSFAYDKDYVPTASDYAALATLLTDEKLPRVAKIYLDRTVATGGNGLQLDPLHLPSQPFTFALTDHPGYLHFDAANYAITEMSAKPTGHEFGIRAREKTTGMEILGFLYIPDPAPKTSAGCRDWQLKLEAGEVKYRKYTGKREFTSASGSNIAIAEYEASKTPTPYRYNSRVFVATGDLCADITFTSGDPVTSAVIDPILSTFVFDPDRPSDFLAKFRYATVLFQHKQFAAAAPVFESSLTLVSAVEDPTSWRRVATDQASMAYGMAGNLNRSRAVNEAAIAKDPDYPLYYYNLACADAESGDATASKLHLQQAFDRRANTIQGEKLPDPATDDSILKLKKDQAFWAFVQSLPKS